MTNTIHFKEFNDSLGTRSLGAQIRDSIIELTKSSDKIVLDFADVRIVTNSFANECFGKLRETITDDVFRSKVAFINANDLIQRVIISAL